MWLINICCFVSVVLLVWGIIQIRFQRLEDEDRSMNLGSAFLLNSLKPLIQIIAYVLQKTGDEKIKRKYTTKLIISGNKFNLIPVEFAALKWLSAIAGMVIGLYIVMALHINSAAIAVIGIIVYFFPDFWLHETTLKRKTSISKELPYCMDLLTLSVEAGMSFQGAIAKVVEKGARGAIREELEKMLQDLRLGLVRHEALAALSKRTDLYEIRAFTSALIQAEKLGTPIGKALRIQSDLRRTERFHKAEKTAQEAPVKMLMPLLLFILPAVFIIILGPVGLKFMAEGM
ncbi:MAG: type II secretion system F family protein [Desulfobacteraceae bacterium]|jgi:tight adherence protein C